MPFKLGIITDELSDDLGAALAFIREYQLPDCELRQIWGKNVMSLSAAEIKDAKSVISDSGVNVSCIASPLFKWNLPEEPAKPAERDEFGAHYSEQDCGRLLTRAFELAHFFGAPKVRIFSYWRVENPELAYPYVRDRLAQAAESASKNGVLLAVENEMVCNVGTGEELGRILKDINSPHLRGLWDPGNAAMLGETPYPEGYRRVEGLFEHLHVKDVAKKPQTEHLRWAPAGAGFIDWRGQFQALVDCHYGGGISLETHYRRADGNKIESTRESLLGLLKIIHDAES